jgi:hypothetical protein
MLERMANPRGSANRNHWQVRVTTLDSNDAIVASDHLALTASERIDMMADCVLIMRRVQGKRGLPRFRRVYRVLER